jgi:hypothetical protein
MPVITRDHTAKPSTDAERMKAAGDEAAEILRQHQRGTIDSEEAARRLNELRNRDRTFFDRLVG